MIVSIPAVILRTRPLREADLWVRVATPNGRMSGVANAALKSRKRFPFGFPIGSEVLLSYQEGKSPDLVTLQEMTLIHGLLGREGIDHRVLGAVGYALELVDRSWPEHQESPEKFACLTQFLRQVPDSTSAAECLLNFCWEWLRLLGVAPMMTACVRCDAPDMGQRDWRIITSAGGLVCPACSHAQERGIERTAHWKQDVVQFWIAHVLELNLKAESWWKLLWKTTQG